MYDFILLKGRKMEISQIQIFVKANWRGVLVSVFDWQQLAGWALVQVLCRILFPCHRVHANSLIWSSVTSRLIVSGPLSWRLFQCFDFCSQEQGGISEETWARLQEPNLHGNILLFQHTPLLEICKWLDWSDATSHHHFSFIPKQTDKLQNQEPSINLKY